MLSLNVLYPPNSSKEAVIILGLGRISAQMKQR
jgi:hypothetical protein